MGGSSNTHHWYFLAEVDLLSFFLSPDRAGFLVNPYKEQEWQWEAGFQRSELRSAQPSFHNILNVYRR